jgi:hypothetical protein
LKLTLADIATPQMTKKNNYITGCFLSAGLLFFVTIFIILPQITVDLSKTNAITGCVTNSGITTKSSITGGPYRFKIDGKVFFITLDNSNETFATYRPSQNYEKLAKSIKVGDIVTINYSGSNSEGFNLDVYQIKKDGQIIQDYDSYDKNHKIFAWLTGIAFFAMIGAALYPYYKDVKRRKNRKYIS